MATWVGVSPGPNTPAGDLWRYTPEGVDLYNSWEYFKTTYTQTLPDHANALQALAVRPL